VSVLSLQGISKSYGRIRALNNLSFDVPEGCIFGVLGPNGSGKTTLLSIVLDVLKADNGQFRWFGHPGSPEQRKKIGSLLETPNFYHYLSAERNLKIVARIKGRGEEDISEVLKTVNLYERKDSKFSTYSLGMKQRLAIAAALLGNPSILVFDEPTNGLDPAGIAEIRELMKQLNREGKTIIMASHILDEVEKVCTHVAIIQKGVLKTVGSVKEVMHLDADDSSVLIEIAAEDNESLLATIQQMQGVKSALPTEAGVELVCANTINAGEVNRWCFEKGIVLHTLNVRRKSLEKRFLEITGTKSER